MGMWTYVFLAYGIVWGVILLYTISLKRRCQAAENQLRRLSDGKESSEHAET